MRAAIVARLCWSSCTVVCAVLEVGCGQVQSIDRTDPYAVFEQWVHAAALHDDVAQRGLESRDVPAPVRQLSETEFDPPRGARVARIERLDSGLGPSAAGELAGFGVTMDVHHDGWSSRAENCLFLHIRFEAIMHDHTRVAGCVSLRPSGSQWGVVRR